MSAIIIAAVLALGMIAGFHNTAEGHDADRYFTSQVAGQWLDCHDGCYPLHAKWTDRGETVVRSCLARIGGSRVYYDDVVRALDTGRC